MASSEIALVCNLKIRVGCQDRLRVNEDADETLVSCESRYAKKVLPHSCEKFMFQICYVTFVLVVCYAINSCSLKKWKLRR